MTSQNRCWTLDGGPGKFDLMVALFDNHRDHPRVVTFTVAGTVQMRGENNEVTGDLGSQPCKVFIESVQREDGSGESWNFEGRVAEGGCFRAGGHVRGYFHTKTRRGTMQFEGDEEIKWYQTHRIPKSG